MSWDQVGSGSTSSGGYKKNTYLTIPDNGKVQLRVISEQPEVYYKHFVRIAGGSATIKCPGANQCVICKQHPDDPKMAARKRGFLVVLDRTDGMLKIFDAPHSVLKELKAYVNDANWGPLQKYDVVVVKNVAAKTEYKVLPVAPQPLTIEQVNKIQAEFPSFRLAEMARPHTPEEIVNILNGVDRNSPPQASTAAPQAQFTQQAGSAAPPSSVSAWAPMNAAPGQTPPTPNTAQSQPQLAAAPGNIGVPNGTVAQQQAAQGPGPAPAPSGNAVENKFFNNFL